MQGHEDEDAGRQAEIDDAAKAALPAICPPKVHMQVWSTSTPSTRASAGRTCLPATMASPEVFEFRPVAVPAGVAVVQVVTAATGGSVTPGFG